MVFSKVSFNRSICMLFNFSFYSSCRMTDITYMRYITGRLVAYVFIDHVVVQATGRFLILSYFNGCLILRSEQAAGSYGVSRRQVEGLLNFKV